MHCLLCSHVVTEQLTDTLRDGSQRAVFFCPACELGMLASERSAEELQAFYGESYRQVGRPKQDRASDPAELFSIYERFQGDRLRLLAPYLTKEARLLEIGCSAGMFLAHAKDRVKEAVGIDYDTAAARYAQERTGCRVYDNDIEATDLQESSFDIIRMFQTLEHVKDPIAFLETVKRYLKPGGVLAIEVPNIHDALVHVYDLPFHQQFYYHAAHLWYFAEKSLLTLMTRAGVPGRVEHIQDYNILNHMNWLLTDRPQKDCLFGLSTPSLPLRSSNPTTRRSAFSSFIEKADREYKQLLAEQKVTSNIFFIGKLHA